MWNRIKQWWAAEGALAGLQSVSDRMLEDMGLERADLRAQVLGRGSNPVIETRAPCACLPAAKPSRS